MCQNRIDLSRYVKEKPFDPTVAGIESKSDIEQKTNSSIVTTYERKILKKKFRRNPTIDRKNKINTPNETDIRSLMNIDIYIYNIYKNSSTAKYAEANLPKKKS